MGVDESEVKIVESILWPNESVELTVRQRRIGPGGSVTVPTSVIATDKRLIIVNKASLGIRKDYEVIPYRQISSVRFEHGLISSSVFVRVQGYDRDQGLLKNGKEEGEIDGLNNKEAEELADYLNKKLAQVQGGGYTMEGEVTDTDKDVGAYVYCSKCGTKDKKGAKFCSNCGAKLED